MPAAPSLLIVPYRSKTGKLYSQIPTSGAGDFTVTRNTEARRFNSAGLIESVASGIPRLDYYTSGGTAGCPALLVEPAATNLAPNANLMNVLDTPTVSGGVTFTTGSTDFVAPDGTSATINKYVGGAASGATQNTRYGSTTIQASASGVHTYSVFVKRGATNPLDFCAIAFALFGSSSGTMTSYFNLASGTAITAGASIQNYGNGWYRLISAPVTLASADLSGTVSFNLASTSGSLSFATSGALNLTAYTWGAQVETGSVATSYIPTTTGTGSRSGDLVSVTGAVSGSIGQTAGTIYCEFAYFGQPVTRSGPIFLRQADSRGISVNFAPTDSPLGIRFSSRNIAGTTSLNIVSGALQIGTYYKIAIAYDAAGTAAGGTQASGVVAYVNGSQVAIGTFQVPDAAGLTQFRMYGANSGSDTEAFNGRIRAAALYTTRLTNAELATLTTL